MLNYDTLVQYAISQTGIRTIYSLIIVKMKKLVAALHSIFGLKFSRKKLSHLHPPLLRPPHKVLGAAFTPISQISWMDMNVLPATET